MKSAEARAICEAEGVVEAAQAIADAAPPLSEDAIAFLRASGFKPYRRVGEKAS